MLAAYDKGTVEIRPMLFVGHSVASDTPDRVHRSTLVCNQGSDRPLQSGAGSRQI